MGLREASKEEYSKAAFRVSFDELKLGCLQRIADATEVMAQNYEELIKERDRYKESYQRGVDREGRLERRVAALKGVITKLKKGRR